ncbi:MAG TPA: glycosyltransferase family 2 protein, partial [Stenomitos sp.]
ARRPHRMQPITPKVTLLIAAYNEEDVIEAKLENCLALEYPRDRLEIVVVADGSTDRTPELAHRYRTCGVRVEYRPERRGKIHAINRVMPLVQGDIVVSSDANSLLNPECLRHLVRHFADPQVACVAGEKRIMRRAGDVSAGEGLYWRYESYLKRCDSELSSVMGAAGELIALRRSVYEPVEEDTIIEDFVLSMRLVDQGLRVIYEPEAYSVEAASPSIGEEFKRKTRIVAGGWQAVVRLGHLLYPRRPLITFQYVSHRVLRWVLVPFLLILAMLTNALLALEGPALYRVLWLGQVLFYALAAYGWNRQAHGGRHPMYYVPFYFAFLNYAALVGGLRFMRGSQPVTWEKVRRATPI